jgi:hypothetical protein
MDEQQEFWKKRKEQIKRETEEKKVDKLKRFDEVFRMLLLVMTITTSIGLSSYRGIDLSFTLLYLLMALGLWMFSNLIGSNTSFSRLEILFKIHAWVLALLVTMSTFGKFWLKVSELNPTAKIPISVFTFILAFASYHYFDDTIDPHGTERRNHIYIDFAIICLYGIYHYF